MPSLTPAQIIQSLQLEPLEPEGGFFRRTFTSEALCFQSSAPWLNPRDASRPLVTSIYYLMTGQNFSRFHRVRGVEIFHFYAGSPVDLFLLHDDGKLEIKRLGPDILNQAQFQAAVPPYCWQALRPVENKKETWSLLGTTVAPGFEYRDFEMARWDQIEPLAGKNHELLRTLTAV